MLTVSKEELNDYIDKALAPSAWLTIDQGMINKFADATRDHQFIHVDEEKAAQTPFGTTIAHGYLTLSLVSSFGFSAASFFKPPAIPRTPERIAERSLGDIFLIISDNILSAMSYSITS